MKEAIKLLTPYMTPRIIQVGGITNVKMVRQIVESEAKNDEDTE